MTTATFAIGTNVMNKKIKIKKELESGFSQWIEMSLPASISIQSGLNNPRYVSIKNIVQAKDKEVIIKNVDKEIVTMQGFTKFYVPVNEKKTEFIEGDLDKVTNEIIRILKEDLKLI